MPCRSNVPTMEVRRLLILYASQTGNAIDVAERLAREAERRLCPILVLSIQDYDPASLPFEETVIFVVSTTGQGDTPDSMKGFWKFLLKRNIANDWLKGVDYGVFGLGDSSYQKYNFVAKKLDKRLLDLGARAIIDKGLGDDQHSSGYEGALDPWSSTLWKLLYQTKPWLFPNGPEVVLSDGTLMDEPKLKVIYHTVENGNFKDSETSDVQVLEMQIERSRSMSSGRLYAKDKPDCFLELRRNHPLCTEVCGKDVRHLEFEAVSSSIKYEVGDVVEVLPSQDPAAVDAFIARCNLDPNSYITIEPRGDKSYMSDNKKLPVKLKTFVELSMDVASASPRRYFFEVMSYFATAEHEKERLQYFASSEGRDDLYQYNHKERRTVLEVLDDFPSAQIPFEWLIQLVPPLKNRAFSISSSLLAHPNQVHLTVGVVSWTTPYKRTRKGLCSTWLASLDPCQKALIPAWFKKGTLPPPPPSLPLILIGPGTGCAPFRAFLEERSIQSRSSGPTAPVLFFFGCRNKEGDFLYKDFWLSNTQSDGILSENRGGGFYVAFSRDQKQKVYVQHKIREESARVSSLINKGADIYVAGSANKMPSDVFSAIKEVIAVENGVNKDAAERWLRTLEKAGKYHVEAWS